MGESEMSFDFKRGDTVRMQLMDQKTNIIYEHPGIVLEVTEKEVKVRRDLDGSLWSTDLNGRRCNAVDDTQYLQLQKVFNPENEYKGVRVTSAIVQVTQEESEKELYNILNIKLWYNNKEIYNEKRILTLESNHMYTDFSATYTF